MSLLGTDVSTYILLAEIAPKTWLAIDGDVDYFAATIRQYGNIWPFSTVTPTTMQKSKPPSFFASLFGRSSKNKITPAKAVGTPPRPFQAISIYHGAVCCAAAKEIDGYRFIARKAPQLPLAGCTMSAACKCRYLKHDDRRSGARRYGEFGLKHELFSAEERRRTKGRRTKD